MSSSITLPLVYGRKGVVVVDWEDPTTQNTEEILILILMMILIMIIRKSTLQHGVWKLLMIGMGLEREHEIYMIWPQFLCYRAELLLLLSWESRMIFWKKHHFLAKKLASSS